MKLNLLDKLIRIVGTKVVKIRQKEKKQFILRQSLRETKTCRDRNNRFIIVDMIENV